MRARAWRARSPRGSAPWAPAASGSPGCCAGPEPRRHTQASIPRPVPALPVPPSRWATTWLTRRKASDRRRGRAASSAPGEHRLFEVSHAGDAAGDQLAELVDYRGGGGIDELLADADPHDRPVAFRDGLERH